MTPNEFLDKILETRAPTPGDAADSLGLVIEAEEEIVDVGPHSTTLFRDVIRLDEDNVYAVYYLTSEDEGILSPIVEPWACQKVFKDTVTVWRTVK